MTESSPTKSAIIHYTATSENEGQRLDNFLLKQNRKLSKSYLYRLIRKGFIRVNQKRKKADYKLEEGDCIRLPDALLEQIQTKTISEAHLPPNALELARSMLLFEDESLAVINKIAPLSVHRNHQESFSILDLMQTLDPNLELVHRLDKPTTGCLILAKNAKSLKHLQAQFKDQSIQKTYAALLVGKLALGKMRVQRPILTLHPEGRAKSIIDPKGKRALTHFDIQAHIGHLTYVVVQPKTGRTHQIRVHANVINHAILGDHLYGKPPFDQGALYLHAQSLCFNHPNGRETFTITAPFASHWQQYLHAIEHSSQPIIQRKPI